jgi:hypothetical protein
MSFTPSSGPVGTVITINGSGFAGANQAWIGNARNVAVTVVSSTQVKVTIPVGATNGAIGIFNPSYAAFSATAFTVTGEALLAVASTTPTPSVDAGTPGEPDTGGGAFDPAYGVLLLLALLLLLRSNPATRWTSVLPKAMLGHSIHA